MPAVPAPAAKQATPPTGSCFSCTCLLAFAALVLAGCGTAAACYFGIGAKQSLESQANRLDRMEKRIGRIADKVSAGNQSIRALIEEAKEVRHSSVEVVRRHHPKLDALLGRFSVKSDGSVIAKV